MPTSGNLFSQKMIDDKSTATVLSFVDQIMKSYGAWNVHLRQPVIGIGEEMPSQLTIPVILLYSPITIPVPFNRTKQILSVFPLPLETEFVNYRTAIGPVLEKYGPFRTSLGLGWLILWAFICFSNNYPSWAHVRPLEHRFSIRPKLDNLRLI